MINTKKKIAIYPGAFNVFHIGHLNILEKAEAIFGKENVIISIFENLEKKKILNEGLELKRQSVNKLATIKENLPSRNVEKYNSFLTDYIWEKEKSGFDVTIIRGFRNGNDLAREVNQLRLMEEMKPDVKVVFIQCDKQFEHISSIAYKVLENVRIGSGHKYIAKEYATAQQVSEQQCVVVKNLDQIDIVEKYKIISKNKFGEGFCDFAGTYSDCLIWIKSEETKK